MEFKPYTYLHLEPTNSSGRVGQGVVIKAKNQTQTRPDQSTGAASGPGLTSLGGTFLSLPPRIFLPGQFSLNSTPQDCQEPTSKAGCHRERWKTPFSMPRAALSNTRPCGKEGRSFTHSFIHSHSLGPELEHSPRGDPVPSMRRFSVQPTPRQASTHPSADAGPTPIVLGCLSSKHSHP